MGRGHCNAQDEPPSLAVERFLRLEPVLHPCSSVPTTTVRCWVATCNERTDANDNPRFTYLPAHLVRWITLNCMPVVTALPRYHTASLPHLYQLRWTDHALRQRSVLPFRTTARSHTGLQFAYSDNFVLDA